jgi:Uncharacterised protein family (UPF0158)
MAAVISLREVIEAMEIQGQDCVSYLDPDTGEIVTVRAEERLLAEDTEDSLEGVPEWQRELLPTIRAVLANDRCLELPDRFDIHEWSIMEEFARAQESERKRQELLDAIHGAGAFRMFRSTIRRLRIEDSWYKFREQALEEIARDWLEQHKLPYK